MAETQNPQGPPEAPGGGMSYDEFRQAFQKGQDQEDPQPKPQQHPIMDFMRRVIMGEHNEGFTTDRALDVLRSAGRGASNMVNETVTALGEGESYVGRKAGLMSPEDEQEYDQEGARLYTQKKEAEAAIPTQIPTDQIFGARSDDLVAGFTEDATQFITAMALTGEAGALAKEGSAAAHLITVGRGMLAEGTAFNPHGGSMAGVLAKIPFAPVRYLGLALMEKPDDSELTVRLKRAASGAIPGVVIDGLLAGMKYARAAKALPEAPPAEQVKLQEEMKAQAKTMRDIAEARYTPPDAHVVVRPSPDGTWVMMPVEHAELLPKEHLTQEVDRLLNLPDPELPQRPGVEDMEIPAGVKEKQAATEAPAEPEKPPVDFSQYPKFTSRGEAEAQAESVNNAINEQLQAARNAVSLTSEQANDLRSTLQRLMTAPTKEDLEGLLNGTHFNFSYYNEPDQILAMVESVSKVWKNEIDAAQKAGGVSVERHLEMVQELMGRIPKAQHADFIMHGLTEGSPVERSVLLNAGDLVMREYAGKAAKLVDVVEQRPHDVVAQLDMQKAAETLVNLQRVLAGANSETGRALRFLQDRQRFSTEVGPDGLKGAESTPAAPAKRLPDDVEREVHVAGSNVSRANKAFKRAKDGGAAESNQPEVGPNTWTVANENDYIYSARKAGKLQADDEAVQQSLKDIEKQGMDKSRDTEGVNANDFSRSRERIRAMAALRRAKEAIEAAGEKPAFDEAVLADNRSLRSEKILNESAQQKAMPMDAKLIDAQGRPTTLGTQEGAKAPSNPIEDLSKALDAADKQLEDIAARAKTAREAAKQGQKLPEEVSPVSTALRGADPRVEKFGAAWQPKRMVAGMFTRQIDLETAKVVGRIAKMADGDVNALYGVGKAANVIREGGLLKGAMEVGINSMLSGIPTAATVHIMGTATTMYNLLTKAIGSAVVGSGAGMREALDQLIAGERFAVENLKVARAAGRLGTSVINPGDVHEVIPGVIGDMVRTPSKVLTASEEFTRVTNYRSEIYAKSLRMGREMGLQGQDLADYTAKMLDAAFTKDGIATVPAALARADASTFRQPLQPGTFGYDLNNFMNKRFATKIIAPFVRTSINMARWQFERTPLLNLALQRSRSVLLGQAGKEAAAQLWTQTAVSGWLAYYAYTHAAAGELTGRGPADPAARPLWLQDHKPYSIKINGDWVSYNRGDPILQPLAIFADLHQIASEVETMPQHHKSVSDALFAGVAALAMSLGDKTYMRSMTDFFESWSGGKSDLLKKWALGEAGALVPFGNLTRSTNSDPYVHEVNNLVDELCMSIPGMSGKVPVKYDLYGNPVMRTVSVFPFKDQGSAKEDVGTSLLKLGKAFAPLNRRRINGLPIDLTDRDKFNDGPVQGLSPYERANQLMREPKHGPALQEQLRKLIQSEAWQKMSAGSEEFPGGERWRAAAELIQSAQRRALMQVQHEYPSLRREMQLQRRIKGGSMLQGQAGADMALQKAGR